MKTNKRLLAALLAALALPVLAEEGPADDPRAATIRVQADRFHRTGDGTVSAIGPASFSILPGAQVRPIKNAPYSAQMVTERQQNLSDGNQIADRHVTMAYRDSAGRTRQEVTDAKGETKRVTIHDPVAGATWILRPEERTATRIARLGEAERQAIRKAAEAVRRAGEEARARVERHQRDDGSEEIVVKRVVRMDADTREHIRQDVRIQVSKALEENSAALRDAQIRLAPLTAGAFGDMKWAAKATVKDLGTRDFNGIKAEGKLRSYEIPAGEIGNRNAIVVSDETWYAPELQVTVYTRHSDPRSGDTVFRLDSLKREEPAAGLFAVPSDYTVKEPLARLSARAADKGGKAQ